MGEFISGKFASRLQWHHKMGEFISGKKKNVFDYNGNMKKGEIFVENSFLSITIAIQS